MNIEGIDLVKEYGIDKEYPKASCDRMSVIPLTEEVMDEQVGKNLTVKIRYVAQNYQEVTNI